MILDSCHGVGNFSIEVARKALEAGLLPDIISTDFTVLSTRVVQSLVVTMSKFLNLNLSIDQVVKMATINPAVALGVQTRYGSLKVGIPANITILEVVEGEFLFLTAMVETV